MFVVCRFVHMCSGSIILCCTKYLRHTTMMHTAGGSTACEPLRHPSSLFQAGLRTS